MPADVARRAFLTFQAQRPELLAQGYQGQWALFHGDQRILISPHRDDVYRRASQEGYGDDEIFVDMIMPEPEAFEEECLQSR